MNVETHATSHIGRVRKGNEDNYLLLHISSSKTWTCSQEANEFIIESQKFEVDEKGVVLAVSDGMGGALAGEVASKMAVETVGSQLLNDDLNKTDTSEITNDSLIEKLYEATVYANHLIHQQGRSDSHYSGMGATFTAAGITRRTIDLVQVGDSRAYLVRGKKIYQVTKDQSLVQQLIDAKQISPEEAETHSLKNVILQALGAQNEIYPVPSRFAPRRDDILLICSDGLSNKIASVDMQRIVLNNLDKLHLASAEMVKSANERGGEDNITLILAKLSGDDLPESTDEAIKLETLDFGSIHDTAEQDTAEIL
ncbi:MAG: protein phosphatase 2C domain-containing protein [Acidobacteriota bacterium]|nr:protein phosphatase 2C domain-containing protein [Acidobacteriota bacterium]